MTDEAPAVHSPQICHLHEKYSATVNTVRGMVLIMSAFVLTITGIGGKILADTRDNMDEHARTLEILIENNREESVTRDQAIATRFLDQNELARKAAAAHEFQLAKEANSMIRVLNVISLNQKRVMEHLQLSYLKPEWVRQHDSMDD